MIPKDMGLITEEMKIRYIQMLENSIYLKKQKILDYQKIINSETNLLFHTKRSLRNEISRLKNLVIPKQRGILKRLKSGESSFSDLRSIRSIENNFNRQSEFGYAAINQLTSHSPLNESGSHGQTTCQQAECENDDIINVSLSFKKNLLSDKQTDELVAEYLMNDSDFEFDDIGLDPCLKPKTQCQNIQKEKDKV